MYVDIVPNRNSKPAILLREGWREGDKIRKRTIANLSHWSGEKVKALRAVLRGERLFVKDEIFSIEQSLSHGHVEAVLGTIKKLKLPTIISSNRCRELDLAIAMIAERVIHPCSKLATTRLWDTTTLSEELAVKGADVDELYDAMDWLLARQDKIEKRLARRHLEEGSLVLYDVSSTYYEGSTCPLAHYGYDRDGKKGKPIIVWGVMTDSKGRPVAVDVYPGNTGDPATVPEQVEKLKERFGLLRAVLVGDRGMLTQTQIDKLKEYPGLGWISALKSNGVRNLVEGGNLQLSLFDKKNIAEITSPDYPGERLVACFNPFMAKERSCKRVELLAATEKELLRISKDVARRVRKPLSKDEIGIKVGKVINRYKVGKHFVLTIKDGVFNWKRNEEMIKKETMLDGIYVIRTSESKEQMSAEDAVRSYKSLAHVERAFRCLKGIGLMVRPIYHRTEDHVKAHILICMLAYYVEWHMRKALAPLLFEDEQLEESRKRNDPVEPAKPSLSARRKKAERTALDGLPLHSFYSLLKELGTRCRNRCKIKSSPDGKPFYQLTELTPIQKKALQLLELLPVNNN